MEIKLKKITQKEILRKEQTFATNIADICEGKKEAFLAIGYELDLEFGQKENEHQAQFSVFSDDENKTFSPGYVSRAMITVKRKKTEDEKAEELRLEEENRALIDATEDTEEADQLICDATLRNAENEAKRSVAFTRVMLVRVYKAFWTEWVSLGEDLDQLQADLDEFLEALTAKAEEIN